MLAVSTLGFAVPAGAATGTVHSVFARACNIALDGGLVTVGVAPLCAGPSNVVIEDREVPDLRTLFRIGERVEWCSDGARSAGVALDFTQARRWRPPRMRKPLSAARIAANLRIVACRAERDPAGRHVRLALARACRAANTMRAERLARRLIGLGNGLTPSGDDFLVGLCASLDAPIGDNAARRRLRARLCAVLLANLARTNAISAHQLQLAASGQFNDDLLRARNALVSSRSRLRGALAPLLRTGASSGAAACEGLRAGLAAQLT